MRNKETGEFELVVGNGFLVSGFFIVILLFAVGVAMGYILGKNSEKSAQAQQTGSTTPCAATDTRPQPSQSSASAGQTSEAQPAASETASATQPARQPEPTPATQPAKQENPPPAAPPKETPKPAPVETGDLPSGFFWQVTASANQEAVRATQAELAKKGFSAYLEPGPNNLTRVIVGPYADTASRAKAKTDLESITGKSPVARTR